MAIKRFHPTHRIITTTRQRSGDTETVTTQTTDVRLDHDGNLQTRGDYHTEGGSSDWQIENGKVLFQGGVPTWCHGYRLEKIVKPETTPTPRTKTRDLVDEAARAVAQGSILGGLAIKQGTH